MLLTLIYSVPEYPITLAKQKKYIPKGVENEKNISLRTRLE